MAGREYFGCINPISQHVLSRSGPRLEGALPDELIRTIATPMTVGFMNRPIGYLQEQVRRHWEMGPPTKGYPGVKYPKLVTVSTPEHFGISLRRIGLQGIQVIPGGVDVFMLNPEDEGRPRAARIGNVVTQRRNGNHFNNVSSNLGYDLSKQLSHLALATFYYNSSFDDYHD